MGNIPHEIADNLETCNGQILSKVLDSVKGAISQGISPNQILEEGLMEGLNGVGLKFKVGEVFIPEVLAVAKTVHLSMDFLRPLMIGKKVKHREKILLGTVQGDLHDIGKNLVGIMLEAAGFEIIDIGINVPAGKFVEAAKENNIPIAGLSSLLTTTMNEMKTVIEKFKSADLKTKIIVGGAPVTQEFADKIGADAYAVNAGEAVERVKNLL
ncbi:MAG: corrinoid protein [Deltaproteobacteria bacterium]|nr:MAG: corrinoid protein [Deltaproteobacteria bacterium]